MADPVKVTVLKAIEAAVSAVVGLGSVHRDPPVIPDREVATWPIAFVFHGDETLEHRNQYTVCTMEIEVQVWTNDKGSSASVLDEAERLAKETDKAVQAGRPAGVSVLPQACVPEIPSDFEAVVVTRYVVIYRHKAGDPFDPATS
jgi:hypothetical protein